MTRTKALLASPLAAIALLFALAIPASAATNTQKEVAYVSSVIHGLSFSSIPNSNGMEAVNAHWIILCERSGVALAIRSIQTTPNTTLAYEGRQMGTIVFHYAGIGATEWVAERFVARQPGTFHRLFNGWYVVVVMTGAHNGTGTVLMNRLS